MFVCGINVMRPVRPLIWVQALLGAESHQRGCGWGCRTCPRCDQRRFHKHSFVGQLGKPPNLRWHSSVEAIFSAKEWIASRKALAMTFSYNFSINSIRFPNGSKTCARLNPSKGGWLVSVSYPAPCALVINKFRSSTMNAGCALRAG